MSATTSINNLPIPELLDAPNIETSIHPFANAVDSLLVSRFTSLAERNSTISSPVAGMMTYVSDTKELYIYNGVSWLGARKRVFPKTGTTALTTTSYINIVDMTIPIEASSKYLIDGVIQYVSTTTANDVRFLWTFPGTPTGGWGSQGPPTSHSGDYATDIHLGELNTWGTSTQHGTSVTTLRIKFEGNLNTDTTPGNLQLQGRLDVAGGTVTVGAHSWVAALKIG